MEIGSFPAKLRVNHLITLIHAVAYCRYVILGDCYIMVHEYILLLLNSILHFVVSILN